MSDTYRELKQAYKEAFKKKNDSRIATRMVAINMVCMQGTNIQEVADCLMESPTWVSKWVERFEKGGIDALWDLSEMD